MQVWKRKRKANKIMRDIHGMPQIDPGKCEEMIRNLYEQIRALEDSEEKEQLASTLRDTACLGLQIDLRQKIEEKRLKREGLNLVLTKLTDVSRLAEYLYKNAADPKVLEKDDLVIISKHLGPELEVLGGLNAIEIDVSKDWVKKLCTKAPSLQKLARLTLDALEDCCKDADNGEKEAVYKLVEKAETHKNQLAALPQDKNLEQQIHITRAKYEKKLQEAEELMEDINKLVDSGASDENLQKNLEKTIRTLELPPTWITKSNDELIKQLEKVIQQYSKVVRSPESYRSDVEIVTKASAGRALCGIYYSLYEPSRTAGRPLLLVPTKVTLSNPCSSQKEEILRFATREAGKKFLETVKSSSVNLDLIVTAGFQGLIDGGFSGGKDQIHASDQLAESQTTNASALQYIWVPQKALRIEDGDINITLTAKKMAMSILKSPSKELREESARCFLKRFGSHYPAGVQTLGGVYFRIVEIESEDAKFTSYLSEKAVKHLKAHIRPIEMPPIGANASVGYTKNKSTETNNQAETRAESCYYNVTSIGPTTEDPDTFQRLLSYESTWALIDRGAFEGFIPVWELLRKLGGTFESVSAFLEEIWKRDELSLKTKLEKKREDRRVLEDLTFIKENNLDKRVS